MKRLIVIITLAATPSGCGHYLIHPGAFNKFESVTFDTISGAQTLIDVSREQFKTGVLPARFKPAMNDVVIAYNTSLDTLKKYDEQMQNGLPADSQLANLNGALAALNQAILKFKELK